MNSPVDHGTVLVVEGDTVLGQVLSRVLARDGLKIVHAVNANQALQMAELLRPRLALVDASLRDGDCQKLVENLHARQSYLPVLVATSDPVSEAMSGGRQNGFTRFLAKPLDLQELRQAVDTALAENQGSGVRSQGSGIRGKDGSDSGTLSADKPAPVSPVRKRSMLTYVVNTFKTVGFILLLLVVLVGFAVVMGAVRPFWQRSPEEHEVAPAKPATLGVELVKERPHTLSVPEEVRMALGIRSGSRELIAVVQKPTTTRPLVMTGSTYLDPTRLDRIRARFAPAPSSAVVAEIGQVPEDPTHSGKPGTTFREIRSGDRVKKGDLLAAFHSVDVGNKKNDLIDAIYQRELDERIVKDMDAHRAAIPNVQYNTAARNLHGDINTINRAISTLKEWGMSDQDIQAVRDEAELVKARGGKHDKSKDDLWARVELRAPDDGVLIERNVNVREAVVDNTTILFQIARLDRLSISAHVPEDDVPALEALPTSQRRWTVQTVGSPPIQGYIDDISYLIDPNQHTAPVKGHIPNPHEILRGGQFITATVDLPPPPDVVEVPINAVVEDGQQSIVFVQVDPDKYPERFTMRRIQLVQRFEKTAFVRSKPFVKSEQFSAEEQELGLLPREPLRPGERILQTGVGELKAALLDLEESQPGSEQKTP